MSKEYQGRPPVNLRREMADEDNRQDVEVAISVKGASVGGYAYHHIDEDGVPICNAGGPDAEFKIVDIGVAKQKWKSPCQMCERIIRQR
ncbi:hypothetical protein ACOZ4B_08810 [Haloferax prahovense]|uniref:hypothetical protein n=1 Tax=Haloferax prahovense TaxID=381852 RepID=UPI003C7208C6